MALDPSIPMQAGQGIPAPANPLDTFGKYQGIANAMATNDAIKAHTASTNQATAQSGGNYIAQKLASFLSLPDNMRTQANARQLVEHSLQEGSITPQMATTMHEKINGTSGTQGLDLLAIQGMIGNLGGQQAVDNVFGTPSSRSLGGTVEPGAVPSAAAQRLRGQPGFVPTGGNARLTLSPEGQNTISTIPEMGPDGKPTGRMVPATGAEIAVRSGNPGIVPGAAVVPGTGRNQPLPDKLRNPNNPQPAATPAAPNSPNQPVQIPPTAPLPGAQGLGFTQSPGERVTQEGLATSSSKGFQDISDMATQARMRRAIYQNMLADTSLFTTGAFADKIKTIQAIITRIAGPDGAQRLGIDPARLAANESFNKLAAQLSIAGNPGSDQRMMVNSAANPNEHTTSAPYILRQLIGNEDYNIAHDALARKHPDQGDIRGFQTNTGVKLDPQVFQYNNMEPNKREIFINSMKDNATRQTFMRNYFWAKSQGLLGASP